MELPVQFLMQERITMAKIVRVAGACDFRLIDQRIPSMDDGTAVIQLLPFNGNQAARWMNRQGELAILAGERPAQRKVAAARNRIWHG